MEARRVFDYIVVGAGSAGCVLANRLTEDGNASVALVEAGGPDDKQEIQIPAAFAKLFKSECDWAYFTEEQAQLNNRTLYWPRGKVLGGSSSLNAMIYTRGNPADYDDWRRHGNEGWGFSDVRPAFEKAERRGASTPGDHGLEICQLRNPNVLSNAFVAACGEAGIPSNADFNGDAQEGAGLFQVTQRRGKRHSCAAAYLKPALSRKNLTVLTHARTTRILFEGSRATGIKYLRNGEEHRLRAAREVILSGGAVNSPQILLLSGVGDADELRRTGIVPVADLPGVGRNLQDHLVTVAAHECTQPVTLAAAESPGNIVRFLLLRSGMLTSNVAEAGAFVRIGGGSVPDIELIFGPTYYMNHGYANPKGHGFSVGAILLHPKSRGTIALQSDDPLATPLVQPEYLTERSDMDLLIEGTKLARRIARAKAFDRYRGEEVWPGSQAGSDAAIEAFIRSTAETLYHPVGTCRMGSDDEAVVDNRLRVRGVEGLRVIDASVMPTIVSGHTNAPTIMIAEKGAGMIRDGA